MLALFPLMTVLIGHPSATTLVLAIAILSMLHAMSAAAVIILIPYSFQHAVRATGLAISNSEGVAIFGGTATYVVTRLVSVTGNPLHGGECRPLAGGAGEPGRGLRCKSLAASHRSRSLRNAGSFPCSRSSHGVADLPKAGQAASLEKSSCMAQIASFLGLTRCNCANMFRAPSAGRRASLYRATRLAPNGSKH
jgi:hypothetical protein